LRQIYHLLSSLILKTLLDIPSSWMNRKMDRSSEDKLLSILKTMSPEWKTTPLGSSSECLSIIIRLKKLSPAKMVEYITKDDESDIRWKLKCIISHDYKGSQCYVQIEWENGEITNEPLKIIAADDPVSCAIYARENDLLNKPGWNILKQTAKQDNTFTCMVNKAQLRSYNTAPRYKYGFEVPRTYEQALRLDKKNGNTLWEDVATLELTQIDDYTTFIDKGHHTIVKPPAGYKKIRVHLIFDVKHESRHKARLVSDGHLTDIPLEYVYSGVVSLRGLRIVSVSG
jgi:hypothetical protein